ncbi:MAG: hypothetical protein UX37_C0024G0011, partial [Microgenomates group bacterium GW2011_GWA2_46_16]
ATNTFTTWSALYTAMLNSLANFAPGRVASFNFNSGASSKSFQYRTIQEFKEGLHFVKTMMDIESGEAVSRTYAKQGGGDRW